jgi:thiol-disulfide isomerase/thioredoxin
MRKVVVGALAVPLLMSAFLLAACGRAAATPAPHVGIEPGMLAPDFTVKDLEGQDVQLSSLRGKAVLLDFWATWCGPCRAEIPQLQKVQQNHDGELVILLVNQGETLERVMTFLGSPDGEEVRRHLRFAQDEDIAVGQVYKVWGLPTAYLINPHGVIVSRNAGGMTAKSLEAYVLEALGDGD